MRQDLAFDEIDARIAFWACLVIAVVNSSHDNRFWAAVWLLFSAVVRVSIWIRRKRRKAEWRKKLGRHF
jgi:hypothetical protein